MGKTIRPRITPGSPAARSRARLARAHQIGDTERIAILRRALQVEQAEEYIRKLVDEEPPLTDEQVTRLIEIFGGGI